MNIMHGTKGKVARRSMVVVAACIALSGAGISGAAAAVTPYAVTATIAAGVEPWGVAVDPSTDTAYVASFSNHIGMSTVSVIDGATNTVTATIPVGISPQGVAVDTATDDAYVTNFGSNTVSVIDGATNTVTATIEVPVGAVGGVGLAGLVAVGLAWQLRRDRRRTVRAGH